MSQVIIIPAVLSTKAAHDYVTEAVFEGLLEHHGDILKPLRTVKRGDAYYRRATIDAALAVAEQTGTLIYKDGESGKIPVKRKRLQRFKADPQGLRDSD